jgi:ribonuclease HI
MMDRASNGKPIHKPVETTYLHTDNSDYGWGAVLYEHLEARGFSSKEDEQQHITWKEMKAARHAVESFLPQPAARNVLLHEDNNVVCHIQTGMTSRSPVMMEELRRL